MRTPLLSAGHPLARPCQRRAFLARSVLRPAHHRVSSTTATSLASAIPQATTQTPEQPLSTPISSVHTERDIKSVATNSRRSGADRFRPIPPFSLTNVPANLFDLSKPKLATLVVLTTTCGYALAPALTASIDTLAYTTIGTGLCIASANAFNQWSEVPFDAQMVRTRNRLLVTMGASPLQAFSLAVSSGVAGVALLATQVNPLTASLGLANIILYAGIYTPMKRLSIANTWAGALVGALPPMMGWAACTGALEPGAWLTAYLLYAWQFPHFNALSWRIREDYSRAGYHMAVVNDPPLNARVALRYSLSLIPLSFLAPYFDITTAWFALDSSFVNTYMAFEAYRFYQRPDDKSSRRLFFSSLVHLPLMLGLLLLHKKAPEESLPPVKE